MYHDDFSPRGPSGHAMQRFGLPPNGFYYDEAGSRKTVIALCHIYGTLRSFALRTRHPRATPNTDSSLDCNYITSELPSTGVTTESQGLISQQASDLHRFLTEPLSLSVHDIWKASWSGLTSYCFIRKDICLLQRPSTFSYMRGTCATKFICSAR